MHDLIVVGGGATGIAAALAARDRGLDVVLVETRGRMGRAVLEAALAAELASRPARGDAGAFRHAVRRAGEMAAGGLDHVQAQLARRGVSRLPGRAEIPGDEGLVIVEPHAGMRETLRARHVLLATGSLRVVPRSGSDAAESDPPDERARLTDLATPPATALVVGGGRAGVELAGLLSCAGAKVTIFEREARLLAAADADVSAACRRALESGGVQVRCGVEVVDARGSRVVVTDAGTTETCEAERLYIVARRAPDLTPLAVSLRESLGLPLAAQRYRTAIPWIWVAGGASGRRMGPEGAQREGRAAVAAIAGRVEHVPHEAIPRFVSGLGGGGWVGKSESECVAAGQALLVGRSRLPGHGRLAPGFVKLIADAGSQRLLGVQVAGSQGHEAVMLGAALIECGASRQDLAAMAFPASSPADSLAEAAASATAP